jgi:intein/homing endonuclease
MVPETLVPGPTCTKPISELRAGDQVWSWVDDGMEAHRVVHAWRSKDQPVVKLRTRNRTVEASADHLLLRVVRTAPSRHVKGGRRGEQTGAIYGVEWARLDELRRGDLLVALDETPDSGTVESLPDRPEGRRSGRTTRSSPGGTDITGDVAWLLGVILGDGTVTDRNIRVCVYGETCEQVRRIAAEAWGVVSSAEHPSYGTILHSVELARLLTSMGMRRPAHDKRVPDVAWTWPRKLHLAFLDGYCDADGSTPKGDPYRYGERTYASSSRRLLAEIRMLHILAGHRVGNLHRTRRSKPITIKGQLVRAARDLYSFVVYPAGRDQHARIRAERGADVAKYLRNGFGLRRVLAIEPVGERETWDIEVEGAHNFVADGLIVHNCGTY